MLFDLVDRRPSARPAWAAAFRENFPAMPIQCAAAEDSDFFGRTFDAVIAWRLMFLLEPDVQRRLITRIAAVLPAGGRLLFTPPSGASLLAGCDDGPALGLARL